MPIARLSNAVHHRSTLAADRCTELMLDLNSVQLSRGLKLGLNFRLLEALLQAGRDCRGARDTWIDRVLHGSHGIVRK